MASAAHRPYLPVMVTSAAKTVDEYVASLAPERRAIVTALRQAVSANLQPGFDESMSFGMPCFEVPMHISGPTYNGKPLIYIAIADQKQNVSLYLMPVYMRPDILERFTQQWTAGGARLEMGKSCVRIKHLDDVPMDVVAWVAGLCSPVEFVERSQSARMR